MKLDLRIIAMEITEVKMVFLKVSFKIIKEMVLDYINSIMVKYSLVDLKMISLSLGGIFTMEILVNF
jgi:hypothetical protein